MVKLSSKWLCQGKLLMLLLLSCFSRVQLCATPETAAHQAPPSLGFSRQEHWSGLPFPSLMPESEVAQSYPTPSNPMDCSLPGSSVHGIFQAKVLEWGAIAFSSIGASLVAQAVKNLPGMQETWVRSLGWEDSLEKGMAIHSSILVWRISCTEEPRGATEHEITKNKTRLSG